MLGPLKTDVTCPVCKSLAQREIRTPPQIDWAKMGAQSNVSPEFAERFDRVHREQAKKEAAIQKEHGDYGPMPGS